MTRTGAALILALVLLAALMLMGLPFLFIQSASVGGARSLAAQQQARQAAEGMAVYAQDIGARTVQGHLGAATAAWTSLSMTISGSATVAGLGLGSASSGVTLPNRIELTGLPANATTRQGVWIEDEQGKLDANRLGPMGWKRLFDQVGIPDWDDSQVEAALRISVGYKHTTVVPPNPPVHTEWNDSSPAGQLADGLARLRSMLGAKGQHLTKLEDLLQVDPNKAPYAELVPSASIFRKPLTPGELERLRPHLTFHALAQARAGLIDNGSVLMVHPTYQNQQSSDGLASVLDDWMVTDDGTTTLEFYARGSPGSYDLHAVHSGSIQFHPGQPRTIGIAATVNLHQATPQVRAWLQGLPAWNGVPTLSRGDMGTQWPFSVPQRGNFAYPQVDTASLGWFTIEARSQVLDRAGLPLARAATRRSVQALPHEDLVERRWLSQGDLAHQGHSHGFSRCLTWPNPVNRLSDTSPRALPKDGDHDPAAGVDFSDAGLTAAPLAPAPTIITGWTAYLGANTPAPSATVCSANTGAIPTTTSGGAALSAIDALRPDGMNVGPSGWQLAYRAQIDGPLKPYPPIPPTITNPTPPAQVEMAGHILDFWVRPDAQWTGIVPLLDLRSNLDQLGRGIDAGGSYILDQASIDRQNHLGLYYDCNREILVLVYAPPSVERTVASGPALDSDNPFTPNLDERCLSTTGLALIQPQLTNDGLPGSWRAQAFTRLWQPNRILHCYAMPGGFLPKPNPLLPGQPGQWSHIQVVLGNGRPGNMALIVDGCVGRQVNNIPSSSSGYTLRWGDQCTLPALVLDETLPAIDPTQTQALNDNSTFRAAIKVDVPAFIKAANLAIADVIPPRGCLLIDDEHIRYETIDPSTKCLYGIQRGARQDSIIGSPDLYRWRPGSQAHSRYTPMLADGWRARTDSIDGRLFTGSTHLRSVAPSATGAIVLGPGDKPTVSGDINRGTFWATVSGDGNGTDDPPVTLLNTPIIMTILTPAPEWPLRGVVFIASKGYFFFVRSGTTFTFSQIPNTVTTCPDQPSPPSSFPIRTTLSTPTSTTYDPDNGFTGYLASIEIDPSDNPAQEGVFSSNDMYGAQLPMVQIASPGHVEWLTYWTVLDTMTSVCPLPTGGTDRAAFLVFEHRIDSTNRGRQRTAWAGHPLCLALSNPNFVHGNLVLPVQNRQSLGRWAQAGDLITILPRNPGNTARPLSLPVRLVSVDGYLAPNASSLPPTTDDTFSANCDTNNGWFAFDRGISSHLDWLAWDSSPSLRKDSTKAILLAAVDMVCGSAWSSADDLSSNGPSHQPSSFLPRLDRLHTDCILPANASAPSATSSGSLFIGSFDQTRSGDSQVIPTQGDMTVDALRTSVWSDHAHGRNDRGMATVMRWISGSSVVTIVPATGGLGAFAVLSTPALNTIPWATGLILIDGEVFAWQRPTPAELNSVQLAIAEIGDQSNANSSQTIKIIGRGLLGSDPIQHVLGGNAPSISDNKGHRPGLWALILPVGPVGMLATINTASNSAGEWWELTNGQDLGTWAAGVPRRWTGMPEGPSLVCQAEPSPTDVPEVVVLDRTPQSWSFLDASNAVTNPNYERYMPAAWMRGLYRTARQDWTTKIPQGVLIIPWQPRYPSALPKDNPVANDGLAADVIWNATMRSRYNSWAGFPLRMHDLRFPTTGAANIARAGAGTFLKMLDDCSTATTQTEVFFLARLTTDPKRIQSWPATGTINLGTPDAVFGSYDKDKPTDGGELRVTWRYTRNLADLTLANQVDIYRALAEGANRTPAIANVTLRGYAPCTTLAVEDAR